MNVQVSTDGATEAPRDSIAETKLERVTGATFESAADLENALARAEALRGKHEQQTGVADVERPNRYARYMIAEQTREELPS